MQKLLPYEIHGNKDCKNTIIFLHGWPDSMRIWDRIISNIRSEEFFIINLSYPNYHEQEKSIFGDDFDVLINRIKYTIDYLLKDSKAKESKKLIVSHDWGSFLSYMLDEKYPKYADGYVTMDVSPTYDNYSLKQQFQILLYQVSAIYAFFVGMIFPYLGDSLAKKVAKYLANYDVDPKYVTARMGYLYFNLYKNMIKSKLGLQKPIFSGYKPSVPICYIYATGKQFQFQSERWEQKMSKQPNELHPMKGGHWLQRKHPDRISDIIIARAKL